MIDLRLSVQESQHHLLAEDRRDHAGSHIQADPVDRLPEMSVLRHSLFCDVHSADDLRSRHERLVHVFVKFPHIVIMPSILIRITNRSSRGSM